MGVNLKSLIGTLNETCHGALMQAANVCLTRQQYDVDIEHLLLTLSMQSDADVPRVLRHYDVTQTRLAQELTRRLDQLKTGNNRTPAFSPRLLQWLTTAWTLASLNFGARQVRSGHLLLALLDDEALARFAYDSAQALRHIAVADLHARLSDLIADSSEEPAMALPSVSADETSSSVAILAKTPALDQYTLDLTARARQGEIDPVLGRDTEIRQLIDILMRRRQNNPILTGEAGVGKTAVVEGLALRIVAGEVPPPLRHVALRTLDLGLLQAGASVRGEFENRLKSVLAEVAASPQSIIMFIDEAHTLIGAGGQAGQGDAANLLKPALARGELRTIAATTWSEYKRYFEKDAALARRFQVVRVEEPTAAQAVLMLRGLVDTLEQHHQVCILDEAIDAAVHLSHRYLAGRQLPDKAVSALDTACARVALGQVAIPPVLEDYQHQLSHIAQEIALVERERRTGALVQERLDALVAQHEALTAQRVAGEARWQDEKRLVRAVCAIRDQLTRQGPHAAPEGADMACVPRAASEITRLQAELAQLQTDLAAVQGETPLVHAWVDAQSIAAVIAGWTGIPIGNMVNDDIRTILALPTLLAQRVIGQDHALDAISQRMHTARARLEDPRRPLGVFLLVGPSGVGKTETALALAETLYGGEQNVVTINMSEYQEAHTVSGLRGSPPGYVGYGEGGILTEAVRRRPYCVVLLDEMEKAHADVMELFYQVFDKGTMEDAEGRAVDFKHTVILLTSNVASATIMRLCADPETCPAPDALVEAIRPELLSVFKPALLGRMTVVPYYPVTDDVLRQIITLQLARLSTRVRDNAHVELSYDEALIPAIAQRCTEVESGARMVDQMLTRTLLPEISRQFLTRMAVGESMTRAHVTIDAAGAWRYAVS